MKILRILLRVFPAPRRRLTVLSVLPLVIFLAVFLGVWFLLEMRGIVRFSSTRPLLLLLVTPWVWWMSFAGLSGLSRLRALLSLITRLGLVGVFIMLLAEPRAVRRSDILSTVYALDVSDSIGEVAQERALEYVTKTVSGKPEKDEVGLVVFGRNAAVELPPRITFTFEVINSRIAKDSTNIEKGLSLAGAILPEENQGRIVLISDGAQTEGNLVQVLDELKAREIVVDVLPVEYDYTDEVWLEKLDLPRFVKVGETYEASIILSSLRGGTGKLRLTENGETIFSREVNFNPGKNRYTLPLYLRGPGYYEYTATIHPPGGKDGWEENNKAINYLYLKGRGKVLVVTDPGFDSEARDWETLVETLKRTGRVVEVCLAYEFPRDALSLMPYDAVIFVNVPADAVDVISQTALRDAVYNQGTGFLMVGGKNSFGPGGYHRTKVEEILPVTMDISQKKVLPKGALAIILHTCEFAQGNEWGKRIAKEAMKVLGARDEIGVLAYSGGDRWLFPLTPAGQYNQLVKLINRAQIGDMPSFATTMRMGLTGLKASDAAMKHMIIISDGDPSPPTPKLINSFKAAKVSISTVAINPHGGSDVSMMQSIAASTGGRYYYPKNPRKLPSIFIKEAKTLKRSMIQNRVFTPLTEFPSGILKGIEAIPQLRGYVLTTPKAPYTVILKAPKEEGEDEENPVLAVWRCGLGKTAAFTSDLSPNWGKEWVTWDRYKAFVNQLMTDISRVERKSDLHMRSFAAGSNAIVVVEDHSKQGSLLEIVARVAGPRQKMKTVELKQVGPGRYQGKFALWGKGQYQVAAQGVGDGRSERCLSGFAVPYSSEYMRFRSNPMVLERIVHHTGGRILTGQETGEQIFGQQRRPKDSSRPIHDWFLIALSLLLLLDVGIRRIQIDLSVILSAFRRKKEASGETLGALLRLKERIKFTAQKKEEKELSAPPPVKPPASGVKEKAPTGEAAKAKEPQEEEGKKEPLSTTQRLLERKKKWKREDRG